MTTRAEHLAEMLVVVERKCTLGEAKAYLARTKHYAGEEALRKVRGEAGRRVSASAPAPEQHQPSKPRFYWQEND